MTNIDLFVGYKPTIIGRVTELHAQYYSQEWNFGYFFEAKVATELADFIQNYNPVKDCIWSIDVGKVIEGSISINENHDNLNTAHLRWFIVSKALHGSGAGNLLMKEAISFCKNASYENIHLWTFKGLEAAQHLYLKYGFQVIEENRGSQWGTTVIEQCYELQL